MSFSSWNARKGSPPFSQRAPPKHSYDIGTKSGLTELYNKKVVHAEAHDRPLGNMQHKAGVVSHSGVKLTTQDGSKWLVHKGPGFAGKSGNNTVVVNAGHMGPRWQPMENKSKDVKQATVGDYVKAGGQNYNPAWSNCHQARNKGMKLN